MSSTAEELPQELRALILQHVDFEQCLSACALVCRKLARAAAAATHSVSVCDDRPEQLDAFLEWASSHGSLLTQLKLRSSSSHSSIHQLPCPNLVELWLGECEEQLCASREHVGLLHSCTALKKLVLDEITLLDGNVEGPAGVAPAASARLQYLKLGMSRMAHDGTQALETRLFPHLTDLTRLDVGGDETDLLSCFLPHISTMASLQQLVLFNAGPIATATLPGIERLTALEDLKLSFSDLEPSCLLPMKTGLTRLYLEHVALQPRQAQQGGTLGASQLLQLLARCTALRELTMNTVDGDWPLQQLAPYSALTASSNLQELCIYNSSIPGAAWAHVFPAGRQLPNLRAFSATQFYGSAGIARLVSCCPALRGLSIAPCIDASLAPLQSLTALTSLDIFGPVSPAAIRSNLAALSQLRSLVLSVDGVGRAAGTELQHLVPLTALTGLTWLESRYVMLSSKAPAGAPPDVWVQLLLRCAADA